MEVPGLGYAHIRQIPDDELLILDELAAVKGMKREPFLRLKIHEIVRHELQLKQEVEFKQIVEKVTVQINETQHVIKQLMERYYEN